MQKQTLTSLYTVTTPDLPAHWFDSYLMDNGLPIYAAGNYYQGDKSLESTMSHRDRRLVSSVAKPGDKLITSNGKDIMYGYPGLIAASGIRVTSTGTFLAKAG